MSLWLDLNHLMNDFFPLLSLILSGSCLSLLNFFLFFFSSSSIWRFFHSWHLTHVYQNPKNIYFMVSAGGLRRPTSKHVFFSSSIQCSHFIRKFSFSSEKKCTVHDTFQGNASQCECEWLLIKGLLQWPTTTPEKNTHNRIRHIQKVLAY